MGTFAKIFIVVNLVLAVVFLGAASTLLGTIEDWKTQYNDLDKTYKTEKQKDTAEIKRLSDDLVSLRTEKTSLSNQVTNLQQEDRRRSAEWEAIKVAYNKQTEELAKQAATLTDLQKDLDGARTEVADLNSKYDDALAATRSAKQTADDLRNDLERANGNITQLKDELAATQKEKTQIAEDLQKKTNVLKMVADRFGADALIDIQNMPPINGQVTGVDEDLNIVLVSVGTDDDVKVGFTMTVYRGGEYVGRLVIDKVGGDWASGHMDQSVSKSFPMKGDDVATQL
jgi:predicted  nucleic acid-binding Zn-ribbon protein